MNQKSRAEVLHGLWVWQKHLRGMVVEQQAAAEGFGRKVVCLSCGNAARALVRRGLDVLWVGDAPGAAVKPERWLRMHEVRQRWPDRFDATSGHLSMEVMVEVARRLRACPQVQELTLPRGLLVVPSGSGETLVTMALAFPDSAFAAAYDDSVRATAYHPEAPLNELVGLLAERVVIRSTRGNG